MSATSRRLMTGTLAAVVLLPAACSSSTASPTSVAASQTSGAPATGSSGSGAAPTTAATSPTSAEPARPTPGSVPETFEAASALGPGPFDLPDTKVGLAELSSYTATLTLTFVGTSGGGQGDWSTSTVMLASNNPVARQKTFTTTGAARAPGPSVITVLGGATYEQRGPAACSAEATAPDQLAAVQFEPAASLITVFGADTADGVAVNDIPADHYAFDERALGQAGRATSKGELWVASSGGYVVKYVVTTKAGADYFGDGIEGTVTWDYELTGVGQPTTINVPDGCPRGIVDAPTLSDAANVESVPGVLSYDTAASTTDVVAFYQAELGKLGWVSTGDPTIDGTEATAEFNRSGETLTLTTSTEGGVTGVQLLLTPEIITVT